MPSSLFFVDADGNRANYATSSGVRYVAFDGIYVDITGRTVTAEIFNGGRSTSIGGAIVKKGDYYVLPGAVSVPGSYDTFTVNVRGANLDRYDAAVECYNVATPTDIGFREFKSGICLTFGNGSNYNAHKPDEIMVNSIKVGGAEISKQSGEWVAIRDGKFNIGEQLATIPQKGASCAVDISVRYSTLPLDGNPSFTVSKTGVVYNYGVDDEPVNSNGLTHNADFSRIYLHFAVYSPDRVVAIVGDKDYYEIEMVCTPAVVGDRTFRLQWDAYTNALPLDVSIPVRFYCESGDYFTIFSHEYEAKPSGGKALFAFGESYGSKVELEGSPNVSHSIGKQLTEYAVSTDRLPKAYRGVNLTHNMTVASKFDTRNGALEIPLIVDRVVGLVDWSDAILCLPHGRRYHVAVKSCAFGEGADNSITTATFQCAEVQ